MLSFDVHSLFGVSSIASVVSQTTTTLVVDVQAGDGSSFSVNEQVALGPANAFATKATTMVGRITGISGDQLTIDITSGNREGSSVRSVLVGDIIINGITPKVLTDIETALISGWIPLSVTLNYASTDGHTFVVNPVDNNSNPVDLTGQIGLGNRIKFTNNSTTFYGIVTAITSTAITLYGGTDYTVANSAITNPFYANVKAPLGFPLDSAKWTEEFLDATDRSQATPVSGTWYNPAAMSLPIPIGAWRVRYQCCLAFFKAANSDQSIVSTLSTANNNESNSRFTATNFRRNTGATSNYNEQSIFKENNLVLASKATYYLNIKTNDNEDSILVAGTLQPTVIQAISAYL